MNGPVSSVGPGLAPFGTFGAAELARPGARLGPRPERPDRVEDSRSDRIIRGWLRHQSGRWTGKRRIARILANIDELGEALVAEGSDVESQRARSRVLAMQLRQRGFEEQTLTRLFAEIQLAVDACFGFRLHEEQLMAGWAMLHRSLVEMQTGEGKSVTATLPAIAVALSGTPVHIVTVNDYLVERDARQFASLFARFGLSVGTVMGSSNEQQRRDAYARDVVYCSNKQLVFDYLHDRQLAGGGSSDLRHRLGHLVQDTSALPLMRGLCFAIVDEADSVLIDDARTPLILAEPRQSQRRELTELRVALGIARSLLEGADFKLHRNSSRISLTDTGRDAIRKLTRGLDGVWRFERYRSERVVQALTAIHSLRIDRDYLVRDNKVVLIDESTGRTLPDRRLQHGLHTLLELKEHCELGDENDVVASISYQQFFNRYHTLSGMSGTLREVSLEIAGVHDLATRSVPTHRPCRRRLLPLRLVETRQQQLDAILEVARDCRQRGRALLIGTRSVEWSERVSRHLAEQDIDHDLLNARQDATEAATIARAGLPGAITVATNMAGRGTDIPLTPESRDAGGLHVLNIELNESIRVDRQLFGRAARQGDPGSAEHLLCLEDEMISQHLSASTRKLLHTICRRWPRLGDRAGAGLARLIQTRCERRQARQRMIVFEARGHLERQLAIGGRES